MTKHLEPWQIELFFSLLDQWNKKPLILRTTD